MSRDAVHPTLLPHARERTHGVTTSCAPGCGGTLSVPWFKVDDRLHAHPKVLDTLDDRPSALALWLVAGSWCAAQLTDGAVPRRQVQRLGFAEKDAACLVKHRLWHTTETGYRFHEWEEYQPTREHVEGERKAARRRMKRHRSGERTGERTGEPTENEQRTNGEVTETRSVAPSRPVPTRPRKEDEDTSSSLATLLARTWDEASGTTGSHTLHGAVWGPIAANVRVESRRRGRDPAAVGAETIRHYWREGGWADKTRSKATPSAFGKVVVRAIAQALGEESDGGEKVITLADIRAGEVGDALDRFVR